MLRTRLELEDFRLGRTLDDQIVALHFGAELPGDALVLYPSFLTAAGNDGVVDGTYVVVDPGDGEVVGQVGTLGPPTGEKAESTMGSTPRPEAGGSPLYR